MWSSIRPAGATSPNPYSYAIRTGDTLFLSGLVSRNGKDNSVVTGDVPTQTAAVMDNAAEILKAAGMTLANVVSARVYLPDVADLPADERRPTASYFSSAPPARATVKAGLAGSQYNVEITLVASSAPRKRVIDDGRPANPNLSAAIRAGHRVYLSGMLGNTAETKGDVAAQTRETLLAHPRCADGRRLHARRRRDAVVYLTDIKTFQTMNDAYRAFFEQRLPRSRHASRRGLVAADGLVEIMVTADVRAMTVAALPLGLDVFEAAYAHVSPHIHRTPLLSSRMLSERTGYDVRLKAEMFQRTGSYKIRGPLNKFALLSDDERRRGVVCSSAGNHAQGVALAARIHGINAVVVMAENATPSKVAATRGYGAEVVLHGTIWDEANDKAKELVRDRGLTYVHPFDDLQLIAGQGTLGLEVVQDWPDVDAIVVPIGGGGLISGVAMAVKALKPSVKVIGVESSGAPGMRDCVRAGGVVTLDRVDCIIDGLRVKRVGETTFEVVRRMVDRHRDAPGREDLRGDAVGHGARQARRRRRRRGASCGAPRGPHRRCPRVRGSSAS